MNPGKYNRSLLMMVTVFIASVTLIFFLMAITYKHLEKLSESNYWVDHSRVVSIKIERIYAELKDLETERRNYILTNSPNSKNNILEKKAEIERLTNEFQALAKDNPEQLKNLEALKLMIGYKFKIVDNTLLGEVDKNDPEKLKNDLLKSKNVMASINDKVDEMLETEDTVLKDRLSNQNSTQKTTPIYLYLISLFSLAMISFAFYRIYNYLKDILNANSELQIALYSSNLAEKIGNYGIWALDLDTNQCFFSENEYRILGYEPNEFPASYENFAKHIHPDDLEYVKKHTDEIIIGKTKSPFQYRIIKRDGTEKIFQATGKKVKNLKNNDVILGITSDITNQIANKKEIEEKNRILEATNKELLAFNYVASHDLQEPLRKIETFISRLKEKDYEMLSEKGRFYLERTEFSARRMRILIDDLLQFSRTTKVEQTFEKTDLNLLMQQALGELQEKIEEKNAKITYQKFPTLKIIPFQIEQLFSNLIGNSLKYSKEGIAPKIKIKIEKIIAKDEPELHKNTDEKFYKFTFTDNGIGFSNEFSTKIFELFSRLHGKMDYEGTGIGLAICKKIVENHKGFIFAEGKPDEGSTFTIFIPETK